MAIQTAVTEEQVKDALRTIVKNQEAPALNWCVNYAKAGLNQTGRTLAVQILYVLSNMSAWRGPEAKETRAILKAFTKQERV